MLQLNFRYDNEITCLSNNCHLILENNDLQNLDFTPYFYKRYVDDCIVFIPKNKIEYIDNKFNKCHPTREIKKIIVSIFLT